MMDCMNTPPSVVRLMFSLGWWVRMVSHITRVTHPHHSHWVREDKVKGEVSEVVIWKVTVHTADDITLMMLIEIILLIKWTLHFLSVWGCSHSPNACNHNINYFKMTLHYMTITTIIMWVKLGVIKWCSSYCCHVWCWCAMNWVSQLRPRNNYQSYDQNLHFELWIFDASFTFYLSLTYDLFLQHFELWIFDVSFRVHVYKWLAIVPAILQIYVSFTLHVWWHYLFLYKFILKMWYVKHIILSIHTADAMLPAC